MEALRLEPAPKSCAQSGSLGDATVRLELIPDEKAVQHARAMVNSLALLAGAERMVAARLMLGAAQLVEIAARECDRCTLAVFLRGAEARLELRFDADPPARLSIERDLQAVNRVSAAEAYSRALTSSDVHCERQLCLARLRYEGQMQVSLRADRSAAVLVADARAH